MKQSNLIGYQVYLKSFCDSNNDGFGDLRGLINKIPYLAHLGINLIWITPIYKSSHYDNGYDVIDYYQIDKRYGNLKDFKDLIKRANQYQIKIVLDIVLNHLSIESKLFKQALVSKDNKKQNYFFFKEEVPNNFESFFSEEAWQYHPKVNKYYYHAFSIKQADLNHQNPKVFKMFINILEYWINLGVLGFRFDVINFLKVKDIFHQNNPLNQDLKQDHLYDKDIDGLNEYLIKLFKELRMIKEDLILIGEIGSDQHNTIRKYHDLFDYTFQFNLGSINEYNVVH
ncbi:MAG: alpha-amylase family glycosyl hydrolase, partial [Bacilli bacterium]